MIGRLALTLSMIAPPSEEAADAAFNAGDYAKALEMYLERAAAPGVHPPDALHGAHDSLLAIHAETGDATNLCRARELARELLDRGSFASADERASWAELEAKDAARIDASGVVCPTASPTSSTALTAALQDPDDKPPAILVSKEGPAPLPAASSTIPRARPRARVISGSALLAAGAGLAAGTAASLAGRAQADATIHALDQRATVEGRDLTPSEWAASGAADLQYIRLTTTATVLGIAAGVTLLTGVALLAVPPRGRSLARVRVRPGGLGYSF